MVQNTLVFINDGSIDLQELIDDLKCLEIEVVEVKESEKIKQVIIETMPGLVILGDSCEIYKKLKEELKEQMPLTISITIEISIEKKLELLEAGVIDCISGPCYMEEIVAKIKNYLKISHLLQKTHQKLDITGELLKQVRKASGGPLLGKSEAVTKLKEEIAQLASNDDFIFLEGVKGSGEEAFARAIHDQSKRKEKAFVYVNCHMLGGNEKELEQTKFDLADGGTIYFDQIDELSPKIQNRLYPILQNIITMRQQKEKPVPDFRVIASTNAISQNKEQFSSLAARFFLKKLHVPSLIERKQDIEILANFYAKQCAVHFNRNIESISSGSLQKLQKYHWPNSLRELKNIIESQVVLSQSHILEIDNDLLQPGILIGGYRLQKKIGTGAIGDVWEAKHQLLTRLAAVKLIKSNVIKSRQREKIIQRFHREAKVTSCLESPNTIKLYDYGVTEEGDFFYVMEFLRGLDCKQIVDKFGPLPPERTAMLLKQACYSLMEAHQKGIIHRDIKPQNLFISKVGVEHDFLKVLDFGIVKYTDTEEKDMVELTQTDDFIGSPIAMPPELIKKKEAKPKSDIYSLGCVSYWLLTGKTVFQANSATRMLMAHISQVPTPPSALQQRIPETLDEIIMRCLEKDIEKRPSTEQLLKALNRVKFKFSWNQDRAKRWWDQHYSNSGTFSRESLLTRRRT